MGRIVADVMARGALVTDEIVIGLIREKLETVKAAGFIFDGFPRTLAQADALGELLEAEGQTLDAVIEMRVDDEALVRRIVARSTCGGCGEVYNDVTKPIPADGKCTNCGKENDFKRRADDNEDSLKTRLMEYYKQTSPLIGYYYAKGMLSRVDGLASMDVVRDEIRSILD
jgi:adenylate kinase